MNRAAATPKDTRQTNQPWRDHYWWSGDGIRLHCRIFGADSVGAAVPVLCLPGLTRNARDFDGLAPALADGRQVLAVDFRGRGDSGFASDAMTYVPLTYVQDVTALLASLSLHRVGIIGTSLGGLVAMLLAATAPERVAGVVLNDIGPEIDPAGLARIRSYVGMVTPQPTWIHAARQVAEANRDIYPDYRVQDWLTMVHRTHRVTAQGRIMPDYDPEIAAPLRVPGGEAGVDLWPAFRALPPASLVVRGALSDILSASALAAMTKARPDLTSVTVDRVGHAPTLDEAPARAAIAAWARRLS